jgi:crotonobetainyl-CoA:carnitine CoA-transferase CaiB-like acyl-CoA transferase
MSDRGLFSGLRVLDLSVGIAGAYATKLLADQGADVLKVEDPAAPDPLRRQTACGAAIPAGEDSALFRFLNAGKRSAAFPGSPEALAALAAEADVLLESGDARRLAQWLGCTDGHELCARWPQLSVISISPWGRTGPYAERPASEWTLQAATGFTARRGRPELGHIGAGGRLGEYAAGSFAAVAALASWREARASGRGRHVDVSMFEAMLVCSTQYWDLNSQLCGGSLVQYLDIPAIEPAKDGWVGFSPQTSEQWQSFCLMIERPEISADDRFLTADVRQAHLDFLHEAIHSWTRARTIDAILELCEAMRVPASPIGNGASLPETDHFVERGVFVESAHGFIQPRIPYLLSDCEPRPFGRAPALGADDARWEQRSEPTSVAGASGGALGGLRVVDLTAFWAGPFATSSMAQLGADVVKVESIARPDGMRFVNGPPGVPIWEGGAIFQGANPDKRAITLALDSQEGRALLRRLVEGADLLVENFSARVLTNLDLEPETLLAWNPRLIVVRMPAWGLDGPWRNRTGFAMNVEQASGIAWRAGYESQPITANFCDPVGSLHAIVAIFAALEQRAATGRGQVVEVPLVEPALNLAAEQVVEYSAYGELLRSEGNRNRWVVPRGVYPARNERFIALAVRSDAEWAALGDALHGLAPDETDRGLFGDPALSKLDARRARHDEIDAAISRVTATRDASELVGVLSKAGIPAEVLINGFHLMPHPQLEARGFYKVLEHPFTGANRYSGLPFVGLADDKPATPPPTLGQHNREVLQGELGLSDEELRELEEKGIIGTRPPWA